MKSELIDYVQVNREHLYYVIRKLNNKYRDTIKSTFTVKPRFSYYYHYIISEVSQNRGLHRNKVPINLTNMQ